MKWLIVVRRAAEALVAVLAVFGVGPALDRVGALVSPRALAAEVRPAPRPGVACSTAMFGSLSSKPARACRTVPAFWDRA